MKLKKLTLAGLIATATLTSGLAYAYSTYWTYTVFYSDATMTTYVGDQTRDCRNQVSTYGTVTPYKRVLERYNCAYPIP